MCFHHPRRKERHSLSLFSKNSTSPAAPAILQQHKTFNCLYIQLYSTSIEVSLLCNSTILIHLRDNQRLMLLNPPLLVTVAGNQVPRCHHPVISRLLLVWTLFTQTQPLSVTTGKTSVDMKYFNGPLNIQINVCGTCPGCSDGV